MEELARCASADASETTRAIRSRWSRRSRVAAEPGVVAIRERSLLRIRHRRRAAGSARGRLADVDLGPERRPRLCGPSAAAVEEIAGRVAQGPPRAPAERVVRVRDGLPDGARHRASPPRGTRCSSESAGTSSETRPRRLAADQPSSSGDSQARDRRPRASAARSRQRRQLVVVDVDAQGRMRAATRCDAALAGPRRPDDRLRAGRRGEHGRVRSASARSSSSVARDGGLAARRRRVRAVGRGVARS